MKDDIYSRLPGRHKHEVIQLLGEACNYYHSEVWTYILKLGCLRTKILYLYFKETTVIRVKIRHRFWYQR